MEIIKRIFRRGLWIVFKVLPVKRNKIVFVANYGRGFSDNPKYIAEALMNSGEDISFVWITEKKNAENMQIPENFKTARINSVSYIYHMSTAKFWVDNARKYYCMKKKGQYYIQTWHGGFGLKKVEKNVVESLEPDYVRMAKNDAAMVDLMLSNSKTLTKLYRDAFWYEEGEILEKGLPRNDRLFNYTEEDVAEIRNRLQIPDGVKIALYAPTFRKDKTLKAYDMDYNNCLDNLGKRFGGKWILLLRLHPNVLKLSDDIGEDGIRIFNASKYNDIQELYILSDLVITDYSSVMFDFMLTKKPCILYASDVEDYKKDRDFFVTIDSLPFPLAQTNEELSDIILSFDKELYDKRVKEFYDYHGFCDDGNASKAAADWIINRIDK